MDIFAELEKLRRVHHVCDGDCYYSCPKSGECCDDQANEAGNCDCGADKHNDTLDGIIQYMKDPVWVGLDLANKPDMGAEFTFENLEKLGKMLAESEKEG